MYVYSWATDYSLRDPSWFQEGQIKFRLHFYNSPGHRKAHNVIYMRWSTTPSVGLIKCALQQGCLLSPYRRCHTQLTDEPSKHFMILIILLFHEKYMIKILNYLYLHLSFTSLKSLEVAPQI